MKNQLLFAFLIVRRMGLWTQNNREMAYYSYAQNKETTNTKKDLPEKNLLNKPIPKNNSTNIQKLIARHRTYQVWVKQLDELLTVQVWLALRAPITLLHSARCISCIPHRSMTSSISASSVNKQLRCPSCCSSRRSWSSQADLTVWILEAAHLQLTMVRSFHIRLTTSLISEPKDFDTLYTFMPQSLKKSFLQLITCYMCSQWLGHLDRRQINDRFEFQSLQEGKRDIRRRYAPIDIVRNHVKVTGRNVFGHEIEWLKNEQTNIRTN